MGRFLLSAFADEYSPELDVQLAVLAEHGFTHIEPRFLLGKNVSALTAAEAREVRKKLDAAMPCSKISQGCSTSPSVPA